MNSSQKGADYEPLPTLAAGDGPAGVRLTLGGVSDMDAEQADWDDVKDIPCDEPQFDHKRRVRALGVAFDVPVCKCGTDIADHYEGAGCDV